MSPCCRAAAATSPYARVSCGRDGVFSLLVAAGRTYILVRIPSGCRCATGWHLWRF
ncbi:hypothetical protein HMPREF0004_3756 [Achromobacter piechaudii ATCC 43553]|uniref:Uncharacterized protein n=1 Tax=Achromobacter piechaudii ATCC 43553 TaxID=742159 RepID=D4XE59_9BURK|nr:hypothetical protein HMPREF0004_3756 [Achromobacter piechaudii ATCC 43553]